MVGEASLITDLSQLDPNGQYSYADYLRWKFTQFVELLRGRILPMAAPSEFHQRVSWQLGGLFYTYFRDKSCRAYAAPFDVRLFDKRKSAQADRDIYTVVQPDLCVVCDRAKIDTRGCLGAPDLVVEILSESNHAREMDIKYSLYEEAGVLEYWIISPQDQTALVYVLNDEGIFVGLKPVTNEGTLRSRIFPDLEVDMATVFADN